VRDVQHRLNALGYDLGREQEDGRYGVATATAVKAFRTAAGLPAGEELDQAAWAALVDATFLLGDRVLYLRMPHFHGRDVMLLQTALASLGFACGLDGIFGPNTERAVRDFQTNVGIEGDGIVGTSTFRAIERLRHAWQGKDVGTVAERELGFARAAAVLEQTSICVFGTDETAHSIAERISNLAAATTPNALVTSAPTPVCGKAVEVARLDEAARLAGVAPGKAVEAAPAQPLDTAQPPAPAPFVMRLSCFPVAPGDGIPLVQFDGDATINARMRTAVETCRTGQARGQGQPCIVVEIELEPEEAPAFSTRQEQHCAIALLDALCFAFA
jgi:peptidoglycan hydrolase-like protein with peptidoglycan-binding domain